MENLYKTSLAISFFGVFFLFLISTTMQEKSVTSYSELKLNELVTTQGKILNINTFDDFSIIKLDNNITITCNCQFEEEQEIEVKGRVLQYKKQLQIQAEKISLLS